MTDKKTETSKDDSARAKSPVLTTPASKRASQPGAAGEPGQRRSRSVMAPLALVLALAAAGLSGALWLQLQEARQTQESLAARLASVESAANRAGGQAGQALGRLNDQQGALNALQSRLDEAAAVITDLDTALRSMTDRGSELVLLNDIEHLATIAQQQLELGGNVRNAIVALESAQAQLARANRPALASLLQTVNGDLDRLRAASTIDIAAFSRQLEELARLLSEAPLIMPDEAGRQAEKPSDTPEPQQPAPDPASSVGDAWWEQAWDTTRSWSNSAWNSITQDLGRFIDVRRVDDASALLMSPDQAARFRENLRTRVMTAQLALMMRQPEIWKAETEAIVRAVETRYDEASAMTRKALRLARAMADASIDASLPTVNNTLQALITLREEQTRNFGMEEASVPANGSSEPEQAAESREISPGNAAPANGSAEVDRSSDGSSDTDGTADTNGRNTNGTTATNGRNTNGITATHGNDTSDSIDANGRDTNSSGDANGATNMGDPGSVEAAQPDAAQAGTEGAAGRQNGGLPPASSANAEPTAAGD